MPKKQEATVERPAHVIAYHALQDALGTLTALKPNDRSEADRCYAVTITELQKTFAYFNTFVFIPAQGDTKAE